MIHLLNSEGSVTQSLSREQLYVFKNAGSEFSQALDIYKRWLRGDETFEIYTSGSTGTPKLIQLSRSQMEASARMTGDFLGYQKAEKTLCCIPVQYIGGMMVLIRALVYDMELYIAEPSANPLAPLSQEHIYNHVSLVPYQLNHIMKEESGQNKLQRFNTALIGGGSISAQVLNELKVCENKIYQTYGMTETCSNIALRLLSRQSDANGYIPFTQVECSSNEEQCLCIKGAVTGGVMLVTHDRVEWLHDGGFRWMGRTDLVINSGGTKIHPEEVEQLIGEMLMPFEKKYIISSVPDDILGEKVVLLLEGVTAMDERELLVNMRQVMDGTKMPREIYMIPEFASTPGGKIDRKGTRDLLLDKLATLER